PARAGCPRPRLGHRPDPRSRRAYPRLRCDACRSCGDKMKYNRTDNGDETTLEIDGTLDAVTAPDLRTVVDQLVNEKRKSVILELSSLRLIDSSGVGIIVSLFRRSKEYGGEVKIVGLRDQPRAIFRLLRLDKVFSV